MAPADLGEQRLTVHRLHRDVAHDDVNAVMRADGKGIRAVLRREHRVARDSKRVGQGFTQRRVVFDDEHLGASQTHVEALMRALRDAFRSRVPGVAGRSRRRGLECFQAQQCRHGPLRPP